MDMGAWESGGGLVPCEGGGDRMAGRQWLSFPMTSPHDCSAMPIDTSRRRHLSASGSHPLQFWFFDPIYHRIWLVFCCDVQMSLGPSRALLAGASAPARFRASAVVRAFW